MSRSVRRLRTRNAHFSAVVICVALGLCTAGTALAAASRAANGSTAAAYTEPFAFTGKSSKKDMAWILVERTLQATSASMVLTFSAVDGKGKDKDSIALDDVQLTPLVTPSLLRASSTSA